MKDFRHPLLTAALLALAVAPVPAQEVLDDGQAPLAQALADHGPDVARYHEHVIYLAHPFQDGRLPGTPGMERSKDYCIAWLERAGVEPGFLDETGVPSWRQPFPLGADLEVGASSVGVAGGPELAAGNDFQALGLGGAGTAQAEVVFAGYGMAEGPDGYTSFDPTVDLSGKIVAIFRFEPMDDAGRSLWNEGRPGWSGAAGLSNKVGAVEAHGPAAIVLINPPGADDPRTNELMGAGAGGRQTSEAPVLHMTHQAAARWLQAGGFQGELLELRRHFDDGGAPVSMGFEARISVELERTPLIAENVGGLVRGRGELADEVVVIGAHLDHLGMGDFGSRSGPGELHPGADDNASGSAAVLMLADKLQASFDALPKDTPARSILLILFSGEESGLNGSRYYVDNPRFPLEQTALMINFDMIGRIQNRRLQISGTPTARGLRALVDEHMTHSELELVLPEGRGGGSDHLPFFSRGIPYLFGAIADFHDDYHTPRDVVAKLNRVDAVRTVHLFHDLALGAALRAEPWEFLTPEQAESSGPRSVALGDIKVRFGVMPGNYEDEEPGIAVGGVTPGGSAAEAGIEAGDRLVRWDGQKIIGVREWMQLMARHDPGDVVKVGIVRDGEEITLDVTLQARDTEEGR